MRFKLAVFTQPFKSKRLVSYQSLSEIKGYVNALNVLRSALNAINYAPQ